MKESKLSDKITTLTTEINRVFNWMREMDARLMKLEKPRGVLMPVPPIHCPNNSRNLVVEDEIGVRLLIHTNIYPNSFRMVFDETNENHRVFGLGMIPKLIDALREIRPEESE